MTEPIELVAKMGILISIVGFVISLFGFQNHNRVINKKFMLTGFLIMTLGAAILLHPFHQFWDAWWLFFKTIAMAVPTSVWVVAGVTVYFTLNQIYTRWLRYANQYPNGLTAKILGPWPMGLPPNGDSLGLLILGTLTFCTVWLIALVSYALWLIFGGGIAKLFRLLPRD